MSARRILLSLPLLVLMLPVNKPNQVRFFNQSCRDKRDASNAVSISFPFSDQEEGEALLRERGGHPRHLLRVGEEADRHVAEQDAGRDRPGAHEGMAKHHIVRR